MPVSNEMKSHLAGTATLAVFLKLTAKDGSVLAVCTGTRNKIVGGVTYYAIPLAPSRLQATNGLKPDNLEVMTNLGGLFTAASLRSRKWLGARVEYRVMNYRDFSMGHAERRVGFLGKTDLGKFAAKPELESLSQKLTEPVGFTFEEDCDVIELGDSRCGFDLTGNTADGYRARIQAHVTSVLNRQQFTVAFDQTIKPADAGVTTAPDDFYHRGKFKFTSGNNNGFEGQILANEGNQLTLYLPVFYNISVGNTLELTVGCDRKIATCRDRFANAANNRSFFCLPGRTRLLKLPE